MHLRYFSISQGVLVPKYQSNYMVPKCLSNYMVLKYQSNYISKKKRERFYHAAFDSSDFMSVLSQ